ncbi:MAG: hypothetical protein J7M26_00360, partial [Armatimonadetes bacterium]|nr:hypothetical protein [Armatimonadota bacterium]
PPHHRIMLDVGDSGLDIGTVDLLSRNVLDYTFNSAPTDWYAASGNWGTTNRWTCSPQWSWYGGMADLGPVALWNKHRFAGDITVDAYMAWGMIYGYAQRHYKNPNDLNITLCADGKDLFSGYTFIVGGWHNNRTAILKKGKVLASTDEPWCLAPVFEDRYPSTYEHHRKWWGLRARKVGHTLQLYFDNKLALEAEDPDPLQGGYVAVWGYDNRIILARMRLYYEGLAQPAASLPAEKWAVRQILSVEGEEAPTLKVTGRLGSDFEQSVRPVQPRKESFTKLTLATPGADGQGRCLKLINDGPGGTFGADLLPQPVDLVKAPVLSFDYKLPEQAKINLYLQVDGRLLEVIFAGREEAAPLAQVIGKIPGVEADGQWHHARVDLLGLVRRALGAWTANSLVAKELWFGNLNERDYLLAGLGGNQAGTAWCLDNLYLYAPLQRATFPVPQPKGAKVKAVAWAVSRDPYTEPDKTTASEPAEKEVAPAEAGWWWVHCAVQKDDGTWLKTAHLAVPLDPSPPQPKLAVPKPGSVAGDENIVVDLGEPEPGAIDWRTVSVTIAGKKFKPGEPGVIARPEEGQIEIDSALAGLTFEDGKPVEVKAYAADVTGNKLSSEEQWTFTYSLAKDRRPPRVAGVEVGRPYLLDADFEDTMPPLESYSGSTGAVLSLDRSTAASGRGSLCLANPTEYGRYGVRLVKEPFDAGVYRLVSFDYKVPPHYRGDFAVYCNGDWKAIKFCDTNNDLGYIGRVENVQADNQWHHGEFNLYDMLVKDDPQASSYIVHWFVLSDWGRMANFRRREIWLDNLQIIPLVGGASPLKVAVQATDPSGLAGVAWTLDQMSLGAPPRKIVSPDLQFEAKPVAEGLQWIHCRVVDKAGQSSEVLSRRLLVDSQPPLATIIGPAPDGHAAASEVLLGLLDRGIAGIDPGSIVLEVGGKKYTCKNAGLTYDASRRQLTWNCEKVQPSPVVFDDGQRITVRLAKAADYAGNESDSHPMWSWVMDYRMDAQPPPIAKIESPTHRTFVTATFEDGLDGWSSAGGRNGAKVELASGEGVDGGSCVKMTQVRGGSLMQAYACRELFYAEAYPVIAFDYNFQPGTHLDLMVLCNGSWFSIAMTDNPAGAIGRIGGIVADGNWHHTYVNLFPLLRRRIRRGSLAISRVMFADRNSADNKPSTVALFDNFIIGQIGTGSVKLAWRATDATGIQGYSYVVDRRGGTVPDTQAETKDSVLSLSKLDKGLWFLHVRAQDGAGNWGPAAHYAILNGKAE